MVPGEICILAGGLSARMGREKARLRLGRKTLLGWVRTAAENSAWPVRIIRRDAVARCGPMGGVYTALRSTRADRVLFLACDMPFVTPDLLDTLIAMAMAKNVAIFTKNIFAKEIGFPFVLHRDFLTKVEQQLRLRRFSLQNLAKICRARAFAPRLPPHTLMNLNTPGDFRAARIVASIVLI
jgi:molybdenum cofactor guanylyltransferase